MFKKLIGLTSLSLLSLSALAGGADSNEKSKYFRVGYNLLTYRQELSQIDLPDYNLGALDVGVGMFFHKNFGAEARLGVGVKDSTAVGLSLDLSYYLGLYARGELPLNNRLSVYGLAGIARLEFKGSGSSATSTGIITGNDYSTGNDISYGVGGLFAINKKSSVGLEYLILNDVGPIKIDSISLNTSMP